MRSRSALCVLALALSSAPLACKSEARLRHEKLAPTLQTPVKLLCASFANKEGGGCYRDCQTRISAQAGRAALLASETLAGIDPFDDPQTEPLLQPVRERAGELRLALGASCPDTIAEEAPITPSVERCAARTREVQPTIRALAAALDALAKATQVRTGAELPTVASSCRSE